MVAKAARAGFPLIASKSAPMSEGMRFANEGASLSWHSHGSQTCPYISVPRELCDALQMYCDKREIRADCGRKQFCYETLY